MNSSYPSQSYGSQATASQRRRRPRCPQCGSNRYRRDPSTSLVVCESGHVLQGFRDEEAQDGDEFNSTRTQMHRRTLKVQNANGKRRVGRKRMSVATTGVWYGARSRYLYYQVLQLILRMQIKALIKEMPGLPTEIEPICRDLWAMYVSQKIDFVAQPYLEKATRDQANSDDNAPVAEDFQNGKSTAARRAAQAERDAILAEEEEETQTLRDRLRDIGVLEEQEQDELESQTEGTERGATSSEWESAWDQESGEEDNKDFVMAPKKRRQRGKGKRIERHEGHVLQRKNRDELVNLLGILHLGLITLRVPVIWSDLCTLIKAGRLPFLNVVHQLPAEMVAPFPSRAVKKLDPTRVPSIQRLHQKTIALATDLYEIYGIEFPELSSLPILCRFVERLLLPPTFYSAAKSLLAYVDVPMHTVPSESAAGPHWHETEDGNRVKNQEVPMSAILSVSLGPLSAAREVILMAAIVLVAKMRFGLDGEERFESFDSPDWWSGAPTLQEWLASLKHQQEHQQGEGMAVHEAEGLDLLDMDESQLDAYLAYAERSLILSQNPLAYRWRRRDDIGDLLSCASNLNEKYSLPLGDAEPEYDCTASLREKQSSLERGLSELYREAAPRLPSKTLLSPHQSLPGDAHSLYSTKETSQSLPLEYNQTLEYASCIVGCREKELADAVHALEVALIKKLVSRRRTREMAERRRRRDHPPGSQPGESCTMLGEDEELIPMSTI